MRRHAGGVPSDEGTHTHGDVETNTLILRGRWSRVPVQTHPGWQPPWVRATRPSQRPARACAGLRAAVIGKCLASATYRAL